MSDKVFNIVIKLLKQGGADTETVRGLVDIKNAMTAGIAVAGSLTAAYFAVDKVLKATVGTFVTYANDVRTLSQLNGTNAATTSRLIQLTDDYKVSQEGLIAATKKLSGEGKSLTTDVLAAMSDKFLSLDTSAEQTKFLLDNFGKTGIQFAEIMGQGSEAIKAQSAAMSGGLILTDEALKKARQYEMAQDGVQDSTKGLAVALGQVLTPALTGVVQWITKGVDGWNKLVGTMTYNGRVVDQYNKMIVGLTGDLDQQVTVMGVLSGKQKFNTEQMNEAVMIIDMQDASTNNLTGSLEGLGASLEDVSNQYKTISDYAKQYDDGVRSLADAEAKADEARQKYGVNSSQYKDAEQAVRDLEAAQKRQTDMWVLDVMTQQLATDGLTKTEMDFLLQYQYNTGLITLDAMKRAQAEYAYALQLAGLQDRVITITTRHIDIYGSSGGGGGGSMDQNGPLPTVPISQALINQQLWGQLSNEQLGLWTGGDLGPEGAFVGDKPGGGMTPWTEYIDGSGHVYSATETRAMLAAGVISPSGRHLYRSGDVGSGTSSSPSKDVLVNKNGQPIIVTKDTGTNINKNTSSGSGSSQSSSVTPAIVTPALEAVAPVVAETVQSFRSTQRENSQQVSRQTEATISGNANQLAELRAMRAAIDRMPEKLAAQIEKRKK